MKEECHELGLTRRQTTLRFGSAHQEDNKEPLAPPPIQKKLTGLKRAGTLFVSTKEDSDLVARQTSLKSSDAIH